MQIVIIVLYLLLIFINCGYYLNGQKNRFVAVLTFLLLLFLMCGTTGLHDGTANDLENYRIQYESEDLSKNENFFLYYLFFFAMMLGQLLDLSFTVWWALMTAGSLILLAFAMKKHNINPHGFLLFFMAYYAMVFYWWLKLYYGMVFFFLGFGYLLQGGNKNKLRYILFTCVAGGFHVMYYPFLIFALINMQSVRSKRGNAILKLICLGAVILSVILRATGTANSVIGQMVYFLSSDKVDGYMEQSTNLGFYIPVAIQLLCLFHVWRYREIRTGRRLALTGEEDERANILFMTGILTILFYPLFMISVTFIRLLSAYSLTAICYTCTIQQGMNLQTRKKVLFTGSIIVGAYYIHSFIINNWWERLVIPFFTSRYF